MGVELTHAIAINLEMFMHESVGEIGYSPLNEWMVCDYVCVVCLQCVCTICIGDVKRKEMF